MTQALVVFSGGQDSTTCLAIAIEKHGVRNVHAVTLHYGQRHAIEVYAARTIALLAGIAARHEEIILPAGTLKGTSPLVSDAPVEKYADADSLPGGLEKTFVPMRNLLFLTIAANRATLIGMDPGAGEEDVIIYTGVSQEDYGGYPDCRVPFIRAVGATIMNSNDDSSLPHVGLATPLMHMSKKDTVELSMRIPPWRPDESAESDVTASMLLAHSHTCYNGAVPPCGKCHACLLREKGFREAGITDPLMDRLALEHPRNDP